MDNGRYSFGNSITHGLRPFPAAVQAADGVSAAAVLRYMQENQLGRMETKASGNLTGVTSLGLFIVTGNVLVKLVGVVSTAVTSTSGTTTMSIGTATTAAGVIGASTVNNTQFAVKDVWIDSTPAADVEQMASDAWIVIGGIGTITLTMSVNDITAGAINFYCWWKPLSSDGDVAAA